MLRFPASLIVAIEIGRAVVGGDQKIEIAVAIEIAVGQTAADFRAANLRRLSAATSRKLPLPVVQKKMRRLRVSDIAANIAHGFVDVAVGDGEIEPAIEIDIEERAAEARDCCSTPCPLRTARAMSSKLLPLAR